MKPRACLRFADGGLDRMRGAGCRRNRGHRNRSHGGSFDRSHQLGAALVASVGNVFKFRGKQRGRNRFHRHPLPAMRARHHERRKTRRRCNRMSHGDATLVPSIRPHLRPESSRICAVHTRVRQCGMPGVRWIVVICQHLAGVYTSNAGGLRKEGAWFAAGAACHWTRGARPEACPDLGAWTESGASVLPAAVPHDIGDRTGRARPTASPVSGLVGFAPSAVFCVSSDRRSFGHKS